VDKSLVVLFFGLMWLITLWPDIRHQVQNSDARLHMEAAFQRGSLDVPLFTEQQPVPNEVWAYVGPRPLLMFYYPFAVLRWRFNKPFAAHLLWTVFFHHIPMLAALWICLPETVGWQLIPTLALIQWSMRDSSTLGAANPLPVFLIAAAYVVPGLRWVAVLIGLSVAIRILPVMFVPLVFLARWHELTLPLGQIPVILFFAALFFGWMWFMAQELGFGEETLGSLRRFSREMAHGPARRFTAQYKRQAYPLALILLAPWPWLALVASVIWLAYIVVRRQTVEGMPLITREHATMPLRIRDWTTDNS